MRPLRAAGAGQVFRETAGGTKTDRARLRRVLGQLAAAGDVLMVTGLDRLARSTRDLLNTLAVIAVSIVAAAVQSTTEICTQCRRPWVREADGTMHCAAAGCICFEFWQEARYTDTYCGWCDKPWSREADGTRYCLTEGCPEQRNTMAFHSKGVPVWRGFSCEADS